MTLVIGSANVVGGLLSMYSLKKLGRKTNMLVGVMS